jgi:K+-transporting ATPase ATPase B chain
LRNTRRQTLAYLRRPDGTTSEIPSAALQVGDLCVVQAGQVTPGDGDVVEGIATVDESAITGESAPVIRESGGDRCAVTGGTNVLSDLIVVKITSKPGETFLDRMIALVEGANRQKTPNEIALNILLCGLTLILLVAVVTLQPMAIYSKAVQSTAVLVALFVCLAPTTSGPCCRPSASPGWTGWCNAMYWPCRAELSKQPGTLRPCCSTRPARSPTATAWRPRSWPSKA